MDVSQVSFPITIDQFASFSQTIQLLYQDGTPVDLTDWTGKMQVRQTYADTDVILEFSTEDDTIVITGATGTVELIQSAEVTAALDAPFTGVYDLLLSAPSPSTIVDRVIQGTVFISPGVTRNE